MRKALIFIATITLFLSIGQTASAIEFVGPDGARTIKAEKVDGTREVRAARVDVAAENKEVSIANRCEAIAKRIDAQTTRYGENANKRQAKYARIQARLEALVERLQEADKNTTDLEEALVVLNDKIEKFEADAATSVASLKTTQGSACGESEGNFRARLVAARELLATLREDTLEIKKYWQEIVRPIIKSLLPTTNEE